MRNKDFIIRQLRHLPYGRAAFCHFLTKGLPLSVRWFSGNLLSRYRGWFEK